MVLNFPNGGGCGCVLFQVFNSVRKLADRRGNPDPLNNLSVINRTIVHAVWRSAES